MSQYDVEYYCKKAYDAIKEAQNKCREWQNELDDEMRTIQCSMDSDDDLRTAKEVDREQLLAGFYEGNLEQIRDVMNSVGICDSD